MTEKELKKEKKSLESEVKHIDSLLQLISIGFKSEASEDDLEKLKIRLKQHCQNLELQTSQYVKAVENFVTELSS